MGNTIRIGLAVALGIFFMFWVLVGLRYLVLAGAWATTPARLADPQNVQQEYEWFYTQRRALDAQRANVQGTRTRETTLVTLYGADRARWPSQAKEEYSQLVGMETQQQTAYNQTCAAYQARWDNAFHTIVAPGDLPRSCPLGPQP